MLSLRNWLGTVNLFKPSADSGEEEDEQQHRLNLISTRVYLIVLTLLLILLAVILSLRRQTTLVILENPTREQFDAVFAIAQCPCSQISVSYGDFTTLLPNFHQVCTSDFISRRWIETIFFGNDTTYFYIDDFRTFGSAQFQALASLCSLTKASALERIALFAISTLLSPQVLPEIILQSQIQAVVDEFQRTATNTFRTQLEQVREMTMSNRLMSGLQTNTLLTYEPISMNETIIYLTFYYYPRSDGSFCDCRTDLDCEKSTGIYDTFGAQYRPLLLNPTPLMQIPGIQASCLPLDAILVSSFECFYNQTCLDELSAFFPTDNRFAAMSLLNTSRFSLNTTVKLMVDNLMVENWTLDISYENYYNQCAPISCTFFREDRFGFIAVLTKLISLLSGLTIMLKLLIPLVVHLLLQRKPSEPTPKISLYNRLRQLKILLKKRIIGLNIFQQDGTNEQQVQLQRYATRLYILIVLISVSILTLYTSLIIQVYRETVTEPTESEYIRLSELYPNSLLCPCTSLSNNYSTFLTIQCEYHQVCSSDLVSSSWMNYVGLMRGVPTYGITDYRVNADTQFFVLLKFCQHTQQIIDDALKDFLQTQLVSSSVIPRSLFEYQMFSIIQNWNKTTLNRYVQTLELIRATTQGNQLTNGFSNMAYNTDDNSRETTMKPMVYENCSCSVSRLCRSPMGIYEYNVSVGFNIELLYLIPTFFVGCYPTEALLASTLECFYNQSCMMEIDQYMPIPLGSSFNFSCLNASRNLPNETVESMVNRMMVDQWSSNLSFSSYFHTCSPLSCVFEYRRRNDYLTIITTIIGIFGGLSLAYKLLIVIILRLIEKFSRGFTWMIIRQFIKDLFTCVDERKITDRLHFVLLIVMLSILYIFTAFTPQAITVHIEKPSLSNYEEMSIKFADTIQCSCSQISIQWQSFFSSTSRFHQVCSSDFVSSRWIIYLYDLTQTNNQTSAHDFLYSASYQFQLLAVLCELSQKTTNDSLTQLLLSNLISTQLLSPYWLEKRTQKLMSDFQTTSPNTLLNGLSLIRETTGVNMILNTLSTNWKLTVPPAIPGWQSSHTVPMIYQQCNCGLSSKCIESSAGMYSGCYPFEALAQSTLHCFYDQQCIDSTSTFQAMDISSLRSSRFDINTTIEKLINDLMVEEFTSNVSYEKYFGQCAPLSCTYSYVDQSNLIEGITYLVSLYGGLVLICQVIAMILVKVVQSRIASRNTSTTIHPF